MNVLSLFDGISCGRIALERVGVGVGTYYASEIDSHVVAVAKKNYPDTIQLGDVTKWREWNMDWSKIDLIFAGTPCQSFSAAGDGQGFADERGKLFFVMLDILNHCKTVNPDVKWLVENVRMKREFLDVFDAHLGVESLFINSSHFSALNRPRHYWTNIPQNPLPAASETVLADILEDAREDMPWLSEAAVARLERINERAKEKGLGYKDCILTGKDKYLNLDASYYKGCDGKRGVLLQDGKLRMLTPLEAERLQTLPEGYTEGVSNTQRYKAIGNGWTVDVIAHLLKNIA